MRSSGSLGVIMDFDLKQKLRANAKARRRALIRDAVLAFGTALLLFGGWKAIASAFGS
jgi:hypothetical protein